MRTHFLTAIVGVVASASGFFGFVSAANAQSYAYEDYIEVISGMREGVSKELAGQEKRLKPSLPAEERERVTNRIESLKTAVSYLKMLEEKVNALPPDVSNEKLENAVYEISFLISNELRAANRDGDHRDIALLSHRLVSRVPAVAKASRLARGTGKLNESYGMTAPDAGDGQPNGSRYVHLRVEGDRIYGDLYVKGNGRWHLKSKNLLDENGDPVKSGGAPARKGTKVGG